ncbi:MAG: LamG domain-containing protein, partial [Candidatus Micrarchaeia archaeon]
MVLKVFNSVFFVLFFILILSQIVLAQCPTGMISYWKFDEGSGTIAYDYLGYNNGTLLYGANWSQGVVNSAVNLDGVDDYVSVPTSSSLQSPAITNAITIAAWVYLRSIPSAETYIVSHNYRFYEFRIGSWGQTQLSAYLGNGTNFANYDSGYYVPLNQWHHYVVTANGTNVKFYVDGVLVKTLAQTLPLGVYNTPMYIGRRSPAEWDPLNGIIDEVAIFNRSLSDLEIQQLYNASNSGRDYCSISTVNLNFTSPTPSNGSTISTNYVEINATIDISNTSANLDTFKFNWNGTNYSIYDSSLVLALNFNNNSAIGESGTKVVDISKYSNNGTCTNMGSTCNYTSGKFGSAISFDGVDDYINLGSSSYLTPGSGNFTVMAWIRSNSTAQGQIVARHGGVQQYWAFTKTDKVRFVIRDQSMNEPMVTSSSFVTNNTWIHVAAVRDIVTDKLYIYINGVLENSTTDTTTGPIDATGLTTAVGRLGGTAQEYFNGSIDEVRIYNRALSADEIKMHYQMEFQKYNSTQYRFYSNITNLNEGNYTYYAWANDTSGLSGQSEIRSLTYQREIGWWNSSFPYRKQINITSSTPLTDYQVALNITYNSHMQLDFDDIRFVQGGTKLPYWIEDKVDGQWAYVW